MARKKKHEEHENHERWLVSYADFITLLFAFFTSMYAISSVNEGKFRIMSESLAIAFNPTLFTSTRMQEGPKFVRDQRAQVRDEFKDMHTNNYEKIQAALRELQENQKLTLIFEEQKVTIRISEGMLFEPGSDKLLDEGLPVIDEVARALVDMPNSMRIEGHTDNIPISTERFPSNWDLSSARSLKILKYFIDKHNHDPRKLSAIGFGEYRPIDTNDTPSGRLKNRRVDIMVHSPDLQPL
ncbi:MAG: OmpA family protein [Deltaproteobacteria bacterium]|nr:OmpA family protein [Deltaproteobacteria bacterium]MBZ0219267.1 OmpA family protein [Deltaproteobacteria bacterium]